MEITCEDKVLARECVFSLHPREMALPSEQRTCCMMVRPFQPRDSKPSSDLFGVGSAQMGQAVDCGHLTGRQWALAGAAPPGAWPGVPVSSGPRPAWVSLRPALVRFAGWFPDLRGVGAPSSARGRMEAAAGGVSSQSLCRPRLSSLSGPLGSQERAQKMLNIMTIQPQP